MWIEEMEEIGGGDGREGDGGGVGMLYLVKKIPRLFVRNLQTLKEDEGSG